MSDDLQKHPIKYLRENMAVALGLVLIWRSIWYALDALDIYFFGGAHMVSVVIGLAAGLLVLYLPHRNLKALERL
ncbi:MAG: hypothetical protein AAB804_00035 [Patescibacteria group bacterium]